MQQRHTILSDFRKCLNIWEHS